MQNQRGRRHYEGTLYFIIACIAIAVFYVWVMRLAEPAEQARFQYTLSGMRSAVQVRELTAIALGGTDRLDRLDRENPMDLMDPPPAAYAGELSDADKARPGRWYFDSRNGELLYRLINVESGRPVFRRFQLRYRPADTPDKRPGRLALIEVQPDAS